MIYSEVIIVGGGPAGSTCARELKQHGVECLILDKEEFPRTKLCAGWITPKVIQDLKIDIAAYPYSLITFNRLHIRVFGIPLKIKTRQYAIRRYEFDNWLLKRSQVPACKHFVKDIREEKGFYIIDNYYRCRYLIGAGGTACPVYRTYFREANPRDKKSLLVTLEEECICAYKDENCYLWFFENKLPGYAWYIPKGNGCLNVGIGGFWEGLKARRDNIRNHWNIFTEKLAALSLVKNYNFDPQGHVYYQRNNIRKARVDNVFIIGDAVGLATKDFGEGIGPAVESGLLAARAIVNSSNFSLDSIGKYSIFRVLSSR